MISVAIDGPAGAGKSTVSRRVADRLGYIYVDTGAMYRAIAWYMTQKGVAPGEGEKLQAALESVSVRIAFVNGEQRVFVGDTDVSEKLRTPEISAAASAFSALPAVRSRLLSLQRRLAEENNVIMDGRDIGTVILPHAQVKIFLTASPELRAKRRYEELLQKGVEVDYQQVLEDLIKRDYNDSHRAVAPLKPSEDAILVNTDDKNLEQSVDAVYEVITSRI